MDSLKVGRSLRTIRIRLGLRQADVAERAGVSRSFVSKIERGLIGHAELDGIERVSRAIGADLDVRVRWRGEGLDRLLDEAHALLVDRLVAELKATGWEVALEATFNHFGDRGSVDVVGWHAQTASVLICEVKSVVPDAQGTLLPLDVKTRLGAMIARGLGWEAVTVSRLLVVSDRTVNRRRIARFTSLFEAGLPARGHAVRRWLRAPNGSISGLLFLSDAPPGGFRRAASGRQRVNRPRKPRNGTE